MAYVKPISWNDDEPTRKKQHFDYWRAGFSLYARRIGLVTCFLSYGRFGLWLSWGEMLQYLYKASASCILKKTLYIRNKPIGTHWIIAPSWWRATPATKCKHSLEYVFILLFKITMFHAMSASPAQARYTRYNIMW